MILKTKNMLFFKIPKLNNRKKIPTSESFKLSI